MLILRERVDYAGPPRCFPYVQYLLSRLWEWVVGRE
jgi:hypothetical protein